MVEDGVVVNLRRGRVVVRPARGREAGRVCRSGRPFQAEISRAGVGGGGCERPNWVWNGMNWRGLGSGGGIGG